MSEPNRKILSLRPEAAPADKMLVMMNAGELRELIGEIVEQKLKRVAAGRTGLLNVEQAADYLGYSKEWVYKHWEEIGGRKIGGKGLRFDAGELQAWAESRKRA
jgi:predicted DNA-binding transcriptional regulator AlpA